ncbi:acetyltransferase [Coemansia sp. RSA 2603]|nr:acetyltransferase [Coemansia sp. RSA 2603]
MPSSADKSSKKIRLVPATESDVGLILWFIKQLALYEKAPDQVTATEDLLRQNLFGPRPYAEVILAHVTDDSGNEQPAGFALYFHNFSTWVGRPGLYLEDLFVCDEYRGLGIGRMLLEQLARVARERQCGRMEWVVLDWNEPARGFYASLGAKEMNEWIICRADGRALEEMAAL